MNSQNSTTSTVPYELYDSDFAAELESVDELFFGNVEISDVSFSDGDDSDESSDDSSNNIHVSNPDQAIASIVSNNDLVDNKQICECSRLYGKPCCEIIKSEALTKYRDSCLERTRDEIDIIIKYQLYNNTHDNDTISLSKTESKSREKVRHEYKLLGMHVCRDTFAYAHGLNRKTIDAIARDIKENGLEPRVHGNKNKLPKHALTMTDVQNVKQFLVSYGQQNGVPLPGRHPNYRDEKYILLPSDRTKAEIHLLYNQSAQISGYRNVSVSEFKKLWLEQCPYILVMKPATDLCVKCQRHVHNITKAANLTEEEKLRKIETYNEHIEKVKCERDYYRNQCETTKVSFETLEGHEKLRGKDPATTDVCLHYSFDYAQQVLYPHYSQQVGPIYFKTPRKCGCFGVCCESSGSQIFYLLDESVSVDVGKGANSVTSMLHHHFTHHGYGERKALLHMDNCSGQNKNNTVIGYGMWRVMQGLHDELEYSMMEAGHTKFSPDWHFGLWKVKWRSSDAETLHDIARTVETSSRGGHNIPQLTDDPQKPVVFYDWSSFLKTMFKPVPQLKSYHHFRITRTCPGVVFVREYATRVEQAINILRCNTPACETLPERIPLKGLDAQRAWYLYEQIGPLCYNQAACPRPSVPKPTTSYKSSKMLKSE